MANLKEQLTSNSSLLTEIDNFEDDIPDLQAQKSTLETKIANLSQLLKEIEEVKNEPAIQAEPYWHDELSYLRDLTTDISDLKSRIVKFLSTVSFTQLEKSVPSSSLGNDSYLQALSQMALQAKQIVLDHTKSLSDELDEAVENIRESSHAVEWNKAYQQHIKELQRANERKSSAHANEVTYQLRASKATLAKLETQLTEALIRQRAKVEHTKTRKELFSKIERELGVIAQKRRMQAQKMTNDLNRRVIISVAPGKNNNSFRHWLMSHKAPRMTITHIDTIVSNKMTPQVFANLLREGDKSKLVDLGLSEAISESILSALKKPHLLYDLEEIFLEDKPDVRFRRNDGKYKLLEELSTGQKSTVILLLALADDSLPMIYDQPEDALDTALIYSDIAQILRNHKDHRQFIFATHNSNMSVSADLDLAIVIDGTATSGEVSLADGLEHEEVKNLVVTYLEGGTEALQQRVRKLGIEP